MCFASNVLTASEIARILCNLFKLLINFCAENKPDERST